MFHWQCHHGIDAACDYAVAAILTTAPIWIHFVTDIGTPLAAFVAALCGAIIGVRRLLHDFRRLR
jgi:phosphate/sulfate permease